MMLVSNCLEFSSSKAALQCCNTLVTHNQIFLVYSLIQGPIPECLFRPSNLY
ncbi:unnamed protein product [Prunus brigantina]